MATRYDLREEEAGWIVFDLWTGETVVIARVPQAGLYPADAGELVTLLNLRAAGGMRELLQ